MRGALRTSLRANQTGLDFAAGEIPDIEKSRPETGGPKPPFRRRKGAARGLQCL